MHGRKYRNAAETCDAAGELAGEVTEQLGRVGGKHIAQLEVEHPDDLATVDERHCQLRDDVLRQRDEVRVGADVPHELRPPLDDASL